MTQGHSRGAVWLVVDGFVRDRSNNPASPGQRRLRVKLSRRQPPSDGGGDRTTVCAPRVRLTVGPVIVRHAPAGVPTSVCALALPVRRTIAEPAGPLTR